MDLRAEIEARMAAALPIVEEAGALALAHFRQPIAIDNKLGETGFDPVTIADRAVEALIRARLGALWPDSPIHGEEEGITAGTGDWSWIIDPIDGTRAFISGLPAWGILLGLVVGGRAVGGLMCQPFTGEIFLGSPEGAFLLHRGQRTALSTSGRTDLADAILYSTHPDILGSERPGFDRVSARVRMTRYGGDCYAYCLLAHGFVDLVIESALQPYDIVPLIPVIEAAGGVITDLEGRSPLGGGAVVAAATPVLHAAALDLMRGGKGPVSAPE